MNAKLAFIAGLVGLAASAGVNVTFTPVTSWNANATNTLSWTTIPGTAYSTDILNINLYGPVTSTTDRTRLNPKLILSENLNVTQNTNISPMIPASVETGQYFVCAVEGSNVPACTVDFKINGVGTPTTPTNTPTPTNGAETLSNTAAVASVMGLFAYLFM